jgi:16S rRNA (uracil1498-N3)-methyltransferase
LDDNAKKCVVALDQFLYEKSPTFPIHIAISPTKNIDRFEWFLEKATEIGVDIITPIIGENAERKNIKEERFKKILVAALKQSQRLYLPKIHPTQTVIEFIQQNKSAYIAHCETAEKKDLSAIHPLQNVPIMIGPEGDFSKKEIDTAQQKGYIPIALGNNRLRTETAGVYATLLAKIHQA